MLWVRFCAGVREGYGKHLGFRLRLILGAPGRRSRMFAMVIFRGRSSGLGGQMSYVRDATRHQLGFLPGRVVS